MKIDQTTVAVITGAASGIGRALAERLAQSGAALALADVNEAGLNETAARARQQASKVTTHIVDVSDPERVAAFAQEVVKEHGRASLLINNAGVFEDNPLGDPDDANGKYALEDIAVVPAGS